MSLSTRNAITGEINFKDTTGYPDFHFVDLLEGREFLPLDWKVLRNDPYILKPVPLLTRTWMHHIETRRSIAEVISGPDQSIKKTLGVRCMDAHLPNGLSSPLMSYVPASIGACLTNSYLLINVMLILDLVLIVIASLANTPKLYQHARLMSFPLRLGFLAFVFYAMELDSAFQIVGYALTVIAVVLDFATGDFFIIYNAGLKCSYEVLEIFGNSLIFVCSRRGGFLLEECTGPRGNISELVTNRGVWGKSNHLIANLGDLIVELRPLTENDWSAIQNKTSTSPYPMPYLSVEVVKPPEFEYANKTKLSAGELHVEEI